MNDDDLDILLEFLDFSNHILEPPEFLDNSNSVNFEPIENNNNNENVEEIHKENNLFTSVEEIKASTVTIQPTVNTDAPLGHLYCHVCKEYRTVESYWNCHKKNHLLNLFFHEAQHTILRNTPFTQTCNDSHSSNTDCAATSSNYCNEEVCIEEYVVAPVITDYSFKRYDSRHIISKVKIKK